MSHVDLGYLQSCESWRLKSHQFPSKLGGKPSWLDWSHLPAPETIQCDSCHQPLTFLCQIYAPFEEDPENFHRTIFVFICRNVECCVKNSAENLKVFRCSLRRDNEFYLSEPPKDEESEFDCRKWAKLCELCGCLGGKQCGKCKIVNYCCREHQVIDWKEGHKNECCKSLSKRESSHLFPESEVVIEAEEILEHQIDEAKELEKFEKMKEDRMIGSMPEITETDLDKYVAFDNDKTFGKFKKRISDNNDQILRYERGGEPLWIAAEPKPSEIPNCEHCGSVRQFEFQIMPQLFTFLHENDLDIGIVAIYTCTKSCTQGDRYKPEFIFKQDIC